MFWKFKSFFESFEGVYTPIAHDLTCLSLENFLWEKNTFQVKKILFNNLNVFRTLLRYKKFELKDMIV